MYLSEIADHVSRMTNDESFDAFFTQLCRDKGNELWKLVKPMMHQKTTNDWSDMHALMHECHRLAINMILSCHEFTYEDVDMQSRFNPATMINTDQCMMGLSGEDLVHRGAVVKLGVTPKVYGRSYDLNGGVNQGLVYRATVLTKWAEVRQGFSAHRRN